MINNQKTLNDIAWEKLFHEHKIPSSISTDGSFVINAKDINKYREARLMTKFDHRKNLPEIFKENKLSILPITRGSYIIGKFDVYHKIENLNSEIKKAKLPGFIQSIDQNNITSEATAINVAYLSNILTDFISDTEIQPTVNGRMSSNSFDFNIYNSALKRKQTISVENSQVEIDGGFEGLNSLTLVEAKNAISDDFLVRQLYYPFRLWKNKIDKEIKSIFLTYSNGIFSLYEYEFQDSLDYKSLKLTKHQNYTLEDDEISFDEIEKVFNSSQIESEPTGVPFPQADSFERAINICELIYEHGFISRDDITREYDFDVRQTDYYTNACIYLGLLDKEKDTDEGVGHSLSITGNKIMRENLKTRRLEFVKLILQKRAFNESFKEYLRTTREPEKNFIVSILCQTPSISEMAESTQNRRASTVSSWIDWVLDLTR